MAGKKNLKKRFSEFFMSGLLSTGSSSSDVSKAHEGATPSSTSASPAPGDQPTHTLGHKVSPAEVRELHELIRRRCELGKRIWSNRHCFPEVRDEVKKEMDRSDALLARIKALVQSWDTKDAWDGNTTNWKKLQSIRSSLKKPGKQNWAAHPPWGIREYEQEHAGMADRQPPPPRVTTEPDSHLPPHTYRQPPPPSIPQAYGPSDIQPVYAPASSVAAPVYLPYRPGR